MWHFKLICVILMILKVTSFADEVLDQSELYGRVFGGTAFRITDAPYMALYFDVYDFFLCGASIVHEQFLISAAHCYNPLMQYYIKVGTDRIDGGEKYEIESIIRHPKYRMPMRRDDIPYNDISVIKLKRSLKFNDRVRAIALAPKHLVLEVGASLETMGFGMTEVDRPSNKLLKINIPYIDMKTCSDILGVSLTPDMMCAGAADGKDTCEGDSGGPLVYRNMLVGVVSWGFDCGSWPGVYSKISHNREFIDSTIELYSSRSIWSWIKRMIKN